MLLIPSKVPRTIPAPELRRLRLPMLSGVTSMPPEIKNGLLDMESRPRRVPPPRSPAAPIEGPPGCAIVAGGCASGANII